VTWADGGWLLLDRRGAPVAIPAHAHPVEGHAWALLEAALPADALRDPHHGPPLARLRRLLGQEAGELRYVALYALAGTLLGLATPVTVQVLVNTLALDAPAQPVWALLAMLAVCLSAAAGLHLLQRYVVELVQRRVFVRLTLDLALRFPRTPLSRFLTQRGAALVHRFFDVITVQKALASLLVDGVDAAVSATVAMALLALYAPALIGFDALLLLGLVALLALGRGAVPTAVRESKARDQVIAWLQEIATQPELFRGPGGPALAVGRADELAHAWLDAREGHYAIAWRQLASISAIHVAAHTGLLALGASLVREGQLSVGQLVAAEVVVTTVLFSVTKLATKLETFYDLLAAVDKLGHLVDVAVERDDGERLDPEGPGLDVRLVDLVVRHPGPPEVTVLAGARAHLPAGGRLAVVSDAGAGRTTLVDALLGHVALTSGRVVLDGLDATEVRPADLQAVTAVVRGAGWLGGTVLDNLLLDRPDLTVAEAHAALARVGLGPESFPHRLDLALDTGGRPLTEGARLRLTLARAVVQRPRLLILDGALDALPLTEARALLDALTAPLDSPWTLLLTTRHPALAAHLGHVAALEAGRLRPSSPAPEAHA
jgi:ABC-type bacteriocin/lantibiotic exporter with double-glycine peptidase domain